MISEAIGAGGQRIINAIVRGLGRSRINPNALTFTGLLINIGCGVLYGYGRFFTAGVVMIPSNLFFILGGGGGRPPRRGTKVGAFFFFVVARPSPLLVFFGVIVFFLLQTPAP